MSEPIMDAPLKHIRRQPLPWRDSGLTECGRLAAKYSPEVVIATSDVDELVQRYGIQRSAFLLCVQCFQCWQMNARPWRGTDGVMGVVSREGQNVKGAKELNLDFAALAYLVSQHRTEYDGIRKALESGITETELDQLAQFTVEAGE